MIGRKTSSMACTAAPTDSYLSLVSSGTTCYVERGSKPHLVPTAKQKLLLRNVLDMGLSVASITAETNFLEPDFVKIIKKIWGRVSLVDVSLCVGRYCCRSTCFFVRVGLGARKIGPNGLISSLPADVAASAKRRLGHTRCFSLPKSAHDGNLSVSATRLCQHRKPSPNAERTEKQTRQLKL